MKARFLLGSMEPFKYGAIGLEKGIEMMKARRLITKPLGYRNAGFRQYNRFKIKRWGTYYYDTPKRPCQN